MTRDIYITDPSHVFAPRIFKLGEKWIAVLEDSATGLFARFNFEGAEAACKALGGRLASRVEIQALHDAATRGEALELAPFTLPDRHLCEQNGVVYGDQAGMQRLRVQFMNGRGWAEYHDAHLRSVLAALGYDGSRPVAGIGKHWERFDEEHPPPGRAYLMGWHLGAGWIQAPTPIETPPLPGPHGAKEEEDYGTTTLCVWDVDPSTLGLGLVVVGAPSAAEAA